jgi:hypothetical protein
MDNFNHKTSNQKHTKFTIPCPWNPKIGNVHYYIADLPNGEKLIHCHMPWNETGYSGSVLDFLMIDGSTEKVKGPFYEYVPHHEYVLKNIESATDSKQLKAEGQPSV